MNQNEISLDELFSIYTSQEQIKDSFEKRTVPTGRYTFVASKAEARVATEASPWPGRKMGSFFGALKDNDGKRKGSVGFDASWEVVHQTDKIGRKRQDKPSSLWGQLATALGMQAASVAEIITAGGKYPLSVYINEAFKTPEGWRTAKDDESRKVYRAAGYDAKNFVESVSKIA